jgi:hypothetical protein
VVFLRLRNFCHATKPRYATEGRFPHKAIRATFLLQVCTVTIPCSCRATRPPVRSTAFTGTNCYDDNKLSSSSRGCHHSCSVHRPTCYLLIRTSENSLDKGSAVPTGEKENPEETSIYKCGRKNNERRVQANVRPNTP